MAAFCIFLAGMGGIPSVRAAAPDPRLDFSVHTLSSNASGPTALVVGGIQGDEPGGFNAAALIVTDYTILSGRVIVVPNLNFSSIVRRSRGIHGDMNRKFDRLSAGDPERQAVDRIKKLILDPQVDFILNLHDGSGFYSPARVDAQRRPQRWGQSIIVDQARMPAGGGDFPVFNDLAGTAAQCVGTVNTRLLDPGHAMHVKNTRTAEGNREMAKTLTYFALKHHKPAFGIEASKAFLTPARVYYHLLAIEAFLDRAGIRFKRGFLMDRAGIAAAIKKDIAFSLGRRRILLYAENIRNRINYLPMEKDKGIDFNANHPLLALVPSGDVYSLFHGNRRLARLSPQYFEYDYGLDRIGMLVDGVQRFAPFGSLVRVKGRFLVQDIPGHRVNVIGFSSPDRHSESGIEIRKQSFVRKFSIDREGDIYRIEVYKGDKFSGMVLVDFSEPANDFKLAGAGTDGMTPPPGK
ncbi:MAG: succinylglutamate desuccinylase/aspartoacylase family protein [Desulfobacter sp.]|nr:MAG: succinylglutamate desuccinylase/aspartoacylase family protein [Desulfobacter sp.]